MTMTFRSFEACVEQTEPILGRNASRASFLELCSVVEQAAKHSLTRTAQELVPKVRPAVTAWPTRMRTAPLLWINKLIYGALPLEVLHLCAALNLTAALHPRIGEAGSSRALLAWL